MNREPFYYHYSSLATHIFVRNVFLCASQMVSIPNIAAYKHADGKKIDGKRVLVDVERARTVKGWLPRRLGGGLGGTRRGGADVNIKHSGREDNERERERYRLEREREDRDRRGDRFEPRKLPIEYLVSFRIFSTHLFPCFRIRPPSFTIP